MNSKISFSGLLLAAMTLGIPLNVNAAKKAAN